MKTILISEDEKLIRKGLQTMVRRSPVPVETILEARDDEEALSLMKQNVVDLLITDIRMPKMDGIELVSHLGELEYKPLVLVISGYDDFSYAVEMLRQGVFDYMLKPVERERLYAVLEKLEEQYRLRQAEREDNERQVSQILRHLMLKQDTDGDEWLEQVEKYRGFFLDEPYIGFCAEERSAESSGISAVLPDSVKKIHGAGNVCFYAVPFDEAENFASALIPPAGQSGTHKGLETLNLCYREAYSAWQRSFFSGTLHTAEENARFQPINLTAQQLTGFVGLSQADKALELLNKEACRVTNGEVSPDAFALLCKQFAEQLLESYRGFIDMNDSPERFAELWNFENREQYLAELGAWLEEFCDKTAREFDDFEKKQKIREAVQYIKQNFRKPLSMTIVSNEVSMNYSLFSLLFKQYTGVNFVNYLQNLRIEEAKRLLETTDWRVNEICARVGFQDEKHFLKCFKTTVGFSPTEYRKSALLMNTKNSEDE